ncbi:MAG: sce7725 family protein [Bacteroidia bacterium]|nr:sce7725 family protein [Bacteroidia bacterium]
MYYPYLRGRLYELSALDDLAFNPTTFTKVLPIIEPVVFTEPVQKAYYTLVKRQVPFILITNPLTGGVTKDDIEVKLINGLFEGYENYSLGFLISRLTTDHQIRAFISKYSDKNIALIHYEVPGLNDKTTEYINTLKNVSHHIFLTSFVTQRYINSISLNGAKKIKVLDCYTKLESNTAYAEMEEEFFSDTHLTYKKDGFDGFGDFTIMGEKFDEGGGRPKAVVIHWHFINQDKSLRIKHFISDDRIDTTNIPGKFDEAYQKLKFFTQNDPLHLRSVGYIEIAGKGDEGKNPQLGALKKFSMMHHFELVSTLI